MGVLEPDGIAKEGTRRIEPANAKIISSRSLESCLDIVTGDEIWIYCYKPEGNRELAQWIFPGELESIKEKRGGSVLRKC